MNHIFVVGFPRSGTTLFAELLSKITTYPVTPETRFFEELVHISDIESGENVLKKLQKGSRIKDLGICFEDLFSPKKIYPKHYVITSILNCYAKKLNSVGVIEKSPIHILHIEEIRKNFPESKIYAIVRNPSNCLASLSKTKWNDKSPTRLQIEWNKKNSILIRCSEMIDGLVKYEELTENPVDTLHNFLKNTFSDIDREQIFKAINTQRRSTAIPEWEREWKKNAEVKPFRQEVLSNKNLHLIDKGLVSTFGYNKPSKTYALTKTCLEKLWDFYRFTRLIYYRYQIDDIFKRARQP